MLPGFASPLFKAWHGTLRFTDSGLFWSAALLQQVMQLTPEQIAGLPPDQQAQVLALQEHIVRRLPSCLLVAH